MSDLKSYPAATRWTAFSCFDSDVCRVSFQAADCIFNKNGAFQSGKSLKYDLNEDCTVLSATGSRTVLLGFTIILFLIKYYLAFEHEYLYAFIYNYCRNESESIGSVVSVKNRPHTPPTTESPQLHNHHGKTSYA